MFKPDAGLGMRIARTVLVPFGPLIALVVLASLRLGVGSEQTAKGLFLVAFAWFFCSLVLVPALLFRNESPPGSSTDDDGGGGGGSPEPTPRGPDRDPGRIPLPDAEQSRERVRDHVRRKGGSVRPRTAREPDRTPFRVSRRRR